MSRSLLAPFVALGILLVAPGPASAQTHPAPPPDPRLLVVGDSVILGARDAIATQLPGWQVNVVAAESLSTRAAQLLIAANRPSIGEVVVVGLGNNDGETPDLFSQRIDGVMQSLNGVRRVIWVNLRQFASWVPAANGVLAAAATRWPNLEIADWSGRATPNPGLVYADGLHLRPPGQAAMAELIAEHLDAYVEGPSAPSTMTTVATAAVRPLGARLALGRLPSLW